MLAGDCALTCFGRGHWGFIVLPSQYRGIFILTQESEMIPETFPWRQKSQWMLEREEGYGMVHAFDPDTPLKSLLRSRATLWLDDNELFILVPTLNTFGLLFLIHNIDQCRIYFFERRQKGRCHFLLFKRYAVVGVFLTSLAIGKIVKIVQSRLDNLGDCFFGEKGLVGC